MKKICLSILLISKLIINLSLAQATPLNIGESIIDVLAFEGDINTYEFCSAANVPIYIRASSEDINFLGIEFYDEFGNLLEEETAVNVGEILINTPISGKYTILIKKGSTIGNGQGSYSLSVQRTLNPINAIPLCNTIFNGTLDFVTETKAFSFSATQGTRINFNALSEVINFLEIELYGPSGEFLDSDNGVFSAELQYEITASGFYTLFVMSRLANIKGDFSISSTVIDGQCMAVTIINEICDNNIDDDGDGLIDCQDEDCCNFFDQPLAQIDGTLEFCEGESSILTASGGILFEWSNGENTPSITIQEANNYTVTVSDAQGCSNIEQVSVVVNQLPEANIEGDLEFCTGEITRLSAGGSGDYLWNDGSSSNFITVTNSGNYSLTVTNDKGCADTAEAIVMAHPLPNIEIEGDLEICDGDFTTLTANGGSTYRWNSGEEVPSINVDFQFNFRVTVTTEEGCRDSKEVSVIVNDLPDATIDGDLQFCEGESSNLLANGGVTYNWSTGQNIPVINVMESGDYNVTVTDNNGCQDSESVTAFVNPLPIATIEGSLVFCQGEVTSLEAKGGVAYDWNTGETNPTIMVGIANDFKVTVTDDNGCQNTMSVTTLINELPDVSLSLDPSTFCVDKSAIDLAGGLPIGGEYSGNGVLENILDATQIGIGSSSITYTFTDENGCFNSVSQDISVDQESCATSLEANILNTNLAIFPNPATNLVNLKIKGELDSQIRISVYDLLGRNMQRDIIISKGNSVAFLNTQDFDNGTYFFQISYKEVIIYRKVIIARN